MTRYDDVDYWNDRYKNDAQPFEWLQRYSSIRHFFTPKYLCPFKPATDEAKATPEKPFPHSNRVLIIGCGNSYLGQEMWLDGFKQIHQLDFSSVVIDQMRKKYTESWYNEMQKRLGREEQRNDDVDGSPKLKPTSRRKGSKVLSSIKQPKKTPIENEMSFDCHDITKKLQYEDASFDLIVCKGTLDAILCSQNAHEKVQSMMIECHRVLDDGHGAMVIVSYGGPDNRLGCFDNALWKEVKNYTVSKPFVPGITDFGR